MEAQNPEDLLRQLIEDAKGLQYRDDVSLDRLLKRARMVLRRIFGFGADAAYLDDITSVEGEFYPILIGDQHGSLRRAFWDSARGRVLNVLETAIEDLATFGKQCRPERLDIAQSRKVFVVHGDDEGLKQTVARLLERLDLEPVILHEQPNRGRTVIEKFEDYSDVSFAVVLLTPDDMGYQTGGDPSAPLPRARQNVILELGFFLGRLGRERVAALYAGDEAFEKPSDYEGVLFIPLDKGANWRFKLVQELKACGIDVDANRLTAG